MLPLKVFERSPLDLTFGFRLPRPSGSDENMLKAISILTGALALGACTPLPPPSYLAAPSDPAVRAQSRYQSVAAGTMSFRPVDPKGWEELNSRVGPKKGAGDE